MHVEEEYRAAAIKSMNDDVLRRRAASLAIEQMEVSEESRESVLLFALGEEWYGVRIGQVREIYNEYRVTPIPCVPEFITGVINIRGEIVSVTDLKFMMGAGHTESSTASDEQSPVIVVAEQDVCTALMVDAIGDIVEIAADAIEPSLSFSDKSGSEYVAGQFYTGGRLIALVHIGKVLTPVGGE